MADTRVGRAGRRGSLRQVSTGVVRRLTMGMLSMALAVSAVSAVNVVTGVDAARAAGPRPLFQLPFPCGDTWRLSTYPGHDDYDIDMIATTGITNDRKIIASYGGTVSYAGWDSGGGWMVKINHGGGWDTLYLHMIRQPPVSTGQLVIQGQWIGNVGSTGNSSGPHLHHEQKRDGAKVESYFNGVASGITTDGYPRGEPISDPVNVTSRNCGGSGGVTAPALARNDGDGTMSIHRWASTGSAFTPASDYDGTGSFDLNSVGDRVASGDVDGDGRDDIVMAYQISDGTFGFYVWKSGVSFAGLWYKSGPFGLSAVGNRLVVGDFTGDGRAEPALVYDDGDGTMRIFRWASTGSSFVREADYDEPGGFSLSNVGDRVAAGDVNGDGRADIVMAYQISDGTFGFYVFRSGYTSLGQWFRSGTFDLGPVGGRLVVGDFSGDGRAEPALVRENAASTMRIYRWSSTGSSFVREADYESTSFTLANVGERVASGDVDGDGRADIVMAYQLSDGTFGFYVFRSGYTSLGQWYKSGSFGLGAIAGRLVLGRW